ncbi:SipW-dependent-type signal peptide-containing protein [Microbacterium oxydans]|uniref:SipW-dependent-type signal peptide-containing protein n=1 Tax=Microbacterium oxydans TaxID=82380 RepID=UPI00226B5676|nr:SipW-dependent-type signal peptide-containing protein [Microbacterium oxydans]WAA65267.1 SipW-dependent-type signal peptide-containing protein [Microbacterium oxydans]
MAVERDLGAAVVLRRRPRRGTPRPRSSRGFRRVRALLAGGLVLGVGATMTIAAWTDQELATSTVSAGTFSIVSRSDQGAFASHGPSETVLTVPLDAAGLYPGVKKAAYVQVQASGTLGGTVNLTAVTVTNNAGGAPTGADLALQNAIKVNIAVVAGPANCTTGATAAAALTAVPALPAQTLTVSPLNTITYCIVLELPADATGTAQGGTVKPTWTFTGSTS